MQKQYLLEAIVQFYYPELISNEDEIKFGIHQPRHILILPAIKKALELFCNPVKVDIENEGLTTYHYESVSDDEKETVSISFAKDVNMTMIGYERTKGAEGLESYLIECHRYAKSIEEHFELNQL